MPRYEVRLTRDASESIDVIVEAASAEEANEKALAMAGVYGEELPDNWTLDDGCMNKVYLPDEDSTQEVDDDTPLTWAGKEGDKHSVWISLGKIAVQEPEEYAFDTEAELDAFLTGVGLTDGWEDYQQFDTAEEAAEYWEEHKTDADNA